MSRVIVNSKFVVLTGLAKGLKIAYPGQLLHHSNGCDNIALNILGNLEFFLLTFVSDESGTNVSLSTDGIELLKKYIIKFLIYFIVFFHDFFNNSEINLYFLNCVIGSKLFSHYVYGHSEHI
jgi:hypothetical protein